MEFKQYFIDAYPDEAVGYVKQGVFYPIENIATDQTEDCAFDGSILIHQPELIIHSHTKKPKDKELDQRVPSQIDLQNQIMTACEWAICVTDGQTCSDPMYWGNNDHRPPLKDREFIYNIQDCLSYIQDWYHQKCGIKLPNCARSPDWDDKGFTYMDDLYQEWGFVDVSRDQMQHGDLLMFKMLSHTTNHLGIYLGDGLMTWHCEGQVPTTLPLGRFAKRVSRAARHKEFK